MLFYRDIVVMRETFSLLFMAFFCNALFTNEVCAQLINNPIEKEATTNTDVALIWRGFDHQWTYNHRLNRLGSYIQNTEFCQFPYEATLCHTAATGTGSDVGMYNTYYSYIAAKNVHFQSGAAAFELKGKEGKLCHITQTLTVNLNALNKTNMGHYEVVLNGFDIVSVNKADKLEMIQLSIDNTVYLPETHQIQFTVCAALSAKCQSIECEFLNNKLHYNLPQY